MKLHRRSFIRYASLAAAGHAAGLTPFGALNALAQSTSDYKALVCIFLTGGNDGNSLLVPFDTSGYENYASIRGPLSLARNTLLPLTGLPNFALNANVPEIQSLFNSSNAAFVANVGTLVQPITRASYLSGTASTPENLFSHLDQQTLWQNSDQYSSNTVGWGGRIADALLGGNSPGSYPVVTSVSGAQIFCNGKNTSYSSVIPGGVGKVTCSEWSAVCASRLQAAQQLLTFDTGLTLIQADDQIATDAYSYSSVLQNALSSVAPLATVFPANNSLATQLQQIAQIIQVRSALGAGRQIFFASLNGFDTHANQLQIQSPLLAQVSSAMMAFYQATKELNVSNQVTSFTMSDFARALQPNSASGSDHGWGSNHIVVGGAVKGGKLYGTYPTLALGGPDDAGSNGRWIPTTSAVQYAATLASWFGVSATDMATVLPLLSNFSNHNLSFI
jgi:uncharacterized protein (DUF1501 family)